jgi:hypothetical protein
VDIDGVYTYLAFKRGCTLGSTATYRTSDPKVQEALESTKAFGKIFYLDSTIVTGEDVPVEKPKIEEKPVIEEEKEVVDVLDAQTFKNLVELRNALKDKGVDVSQITNVKAAENIAKKNGYNYTIEKNS